MEYPLRYYFGEVSNQKREAALRKAAGTYKRVSDFPRLRALPKLLFNEWAAQTIFMILYVVFSWCGLLLDTYYFAFHLLELCVRQLPRP